MSDLERAAFIQQIKSAFPDGWQCGVAFRLLNELESLQKRISELESKSPHKPKDTSEKR